MFASHLPVIVEYILVPVANPSTEANLLQLAVILAKATKGTLLPEYLAEVLVAVLVKALTLHLIVNKALLLRLYLSHFLLIFIFNTKNKRFNSTSLN
jgi:hypothetical protein